jgi:hypothetical protein
VDRPRFDDYLAPDLHMKNGTPEFTGVQGDAEGRCRG